LLKQSRQAAGLTQEGLAARAGLSARVISDLERNVNHAPRSATVQLLIGALPLSASERELLESTANSSAADVDARALPAGAAQAHAPSPELAECKGAPRLVGRAREQALLERHVAGDGPPLLVVGGEPGVGKTGLLQEAACLAAARGLHVLRGTSPALGLESARNPVVDALRQDIQGRSPVQLRRHLPGCAWLVHLLPELAAGPVEPVPLASVTAEQADALTAKAVVRFLANVAGPAGTLLVLDNLHDADAAALDLLARLIQSAADVPLRIVGAHRDRQATRAHALGSLLARLAQEQLVQHVTLGPLSGEESAELLAQLLEGGPVPGAAWRQRVLEETGGVPFYLVAWAQEFRARQLEASPDEVPWSVRQSIEYRIDAVSPPVRPVLEAVAMAGGRSDYPVLQALTAWPDEQLFEALEAACRERLLEEEGPGYRFAYGVVRRVVERHLSHARRLLFSRRLAALAESPPSRPSELDERGYHLAVLRRHQRQTAAARPETSDS
jgi:transcriptional regulator with XRE-family HTH domain